QAAIVRRDVLDQVSPGRGRRHHRANLWRAGSQTRLRLGCLGLGDGLSRGHQDLSGRTDQGDRNKVIVMTFLARLRLVIVLMLIGLAAAPAFAQKLGPDGAPNPDASVTNQRTLLDQ